MSYVTRSIQLKRHKHAYDFDNANDCFITLLKYTYAWSQTRTASMQMHKYWVRLVGGLGDSALSPPSLGPSSQVFIAHPSVVSSHPSSACVIWHRLTLFLLLFLSMVCAVCKTTDEITKSTCVKSDTFPVLFYNSHTVHCKQDSVHMNVL